MTEFLSDACQPRPPETTGRRGAPRALRPLALGLLPAALLVLAACGSDGGGDDDLSGSGGESAAGTEDEEVLAFYQCLRDNGLDVSDPEPGGGPPEGIDRDDPAHMAAIEECSEDHLDGGRVTAGGDGGQMGDNMADTEALIAYVDCMRDHGIDMPDPAPDGRLPLPEDHDPQSTEFQDAGQECSEHLDGGGILLGEPGEGGMVGRGSR